MDNTEAVKMCVWRRVEGIEWVDEISNEEVLKTEHF